MGCQFAMCDDLRSCVNEVLVYVLEIWVQKILH